MSLVSSFLLYLLPSKVGRRSSTRDTPGKKQQWGSFFFCVCVCVFVLCLAGFALDIVKNLCCFKPTGEESKTSQHNRLQSPGGDGIHSGFNS